MSVPAVAGLGGRLSNWRATALAACGALAVAAPPALHAQYFTATVGTLASGLGAPTGVTVDSAYNIYVASGDLDKIAVLNASGGLITQYSATAAGLIRPWGLAVTGAGSSATLMVADANGNTISTLAAGAFTLLAGQSAAGAVNATGAAASFSSPLGIAIDASGNVYVADQGNDVIREVTPAGVVTTIAGQVGVPGTLDGTGTAAQLNRPTGIAIDPSGVLFVTTVDSVRRVTTAGVVTTVAGSPGVIGSQDGTGSAASFFYPEGIAVDQSDNLYVADTGNRTIRQISSAGVVTTIAGTAGSAFTSTDGPGATATFTNPIGVAVTPNGSLIYVTDQASVSQGGGLLRVVAYPVAPQITVQPAGAAAASNGSFTLSAAAIGGPLPTYQWYLGGTAVPGATSATYTVSNAQAGNAGNYTVVATNKYGSATSNAAVVTVQSAPVVTSAPQNTQITSGFAVLSVTAGGTGPFTYQWLLNGSAIAGATSSSYTAVAAGSYAVTITNSVGSVTSALAVVLPANRFVNLSTRGAVGSGLNAMTAGFITSGSGTKQYLIRGIGPTLASGFGFTGVLAQPVVTLFNNATNAAIATNAGWANSATITSTDAAVGAFALAANSADAAMVVTLGSGSYSAQVTGVGGGTGTGLVEIYEVGADLNQMVNLSTRAQVGVGGQNLVAGLVVSGTTPINVLLRGIGPALTGFSVTGALAHPVLTLFNATGGVIATNTGWSNSTVPASTIASVSSAVGAFALGAGSADAALYVTLAPGSYTVQVSSGDTTTGIALVEAYHAP